jgi:hypothetical protein
MTRIEAKFADYARVRGARAASTLNLRAGGFSGRPEAGISVSDAIAQRYGFRACLRTIDFWTMDSKQ